MNPKLQREFVFVCEDDSDMLRTLRDYAGDKYSVSSFEGKTTIVCNTIAGIGELCLIVGVDCNESKRASIQRKLCEALVEFIG